MLKILVTTDWNDGDYIEHLYKIPEDIFDKFLPLIKAINDFKPYLYKLGIADHNFPIGECLRNDLYEKDVYHLYNQFSEDYIDAFIDTFLSYNMDEEFGMHSIIKIENVVTDEIYLQQPDYSERKAIIENNAEIKKYNNERNELLQKWADLCHCSVKEVYSMPFDKMPDEAMSTYNQYKNLWRKYRPDLD